MLADRTVLSLPALKPGSISFGRNNRSNFLPGRLSAPAYRIVDRQWHVTAARRIKQARQRLLRSTGRASRKHPIRGTFRWQVFAPGPRACWNGLWTSRRRSRNGAKRWSRFFKIRLQSRGASAHARCRLSCRFAGIVSIVREIARLPGGFALKASG
jgi:hypothetical protein